jgi:hypothetical protein
MYVIVKFFKANNKLGLTAGFSSAGGFNRSKPINDGVPGAGRGAIVVTRPLNANAHHGVTSPET